MPRLSDLGALLRRVATLGSPAAEMAFYFALSFVPFLGLTAVAAVAWLPPEVGEPLAGALVRVFPHEAGLDAAAITHWVGSLRSSGWVALGLLLAGWSSFRFMAAGVRALATLGGAPRWDWSHRLRTTLSALYLMLLWMLALLTTSFVLLVAPGLEETLSERGWFGANAPTAAALSHVLAAAVLLLAIALTYRTIPGLAARGWRLWLMAALATAGWIGVATAARKVLPALWGGQSLYGALGSFVLFLLWCWANAWVTLACGLVAGKQQPKPGLEVQA
jgi:uncharacterized BrkB/YihY/UPF0761 family membrane protein